MLENGKRSLVAIRTISYLSPIPEADCIEVATIDGWKIIVKKGEFSVNDKCVYFEIDSFLPEEDSRFSFLMKHVKEFNGKKGVVLKTIKMKKQISQGLALPVHLFEKEINQSETSLDEALGIVKYEKPLDVSIRGEIKGNFPSFIPKTDLERFQNLSMDDFPDNAMFHITLKMDGSSTTVYCKDDGIGVCSRNIELKETEGNAFWEVARHWGLEERLSTYYKEYGKKLVIQGELVGPKIQGNPHNFKDVRLYIFDVFEYDTSYMVQRFPYGSQTQTIDKLNSFGDSKYPYLLTVPCLGVIYGYQLKSMTREELLNMGIVYGFGSERGEGLAFRSDDVWVDFKFKIISDAYLMDGPGKKEDHCSWINYTTTFANYKDSLTKDLK